jgi:hypothetical protein
LDYLFARPASPRARASGASPGTSISPGVRAEALVSAPSRRSPKGRRAWLRMTLLRKLRSEGSPEFARFSIRDFSRTLQLSLQPTALPIELPGSSRL